MHCHRFLKERRRMSEQRPMRRVATRCKRDRGAIASFWNETASSANSDLRLKWRFALPNFWLESKPSYGKYHSVTMIEVLFFRKGSALWAFEDITSRNWRIASGEQLTNFVSHLSRLYSELLPKARTETRWAQTALHVALCCSNRHYAGRSFQVRLILLSRVETLGPKRHLFRYFGLCVSR